VKCAESLQVQAYFDAEVDAVSAANIERHIEHCAECRALMQDLEQTRNLIRQESTYERAPPELRASIAAALDREDAAPIPGSVRTRADTNTGTGTGTNTGTGTGTGTGIGTGTGTGGQCVSCT
jgi:mycothiol system anti-sigma-R factor